MTSTDGQSGSHSAAAGWSFTLSPWGYYEHLTKGVISCFFLWLLQLWFVNWLYQLMWIYNSPQKEKDSKKNPYSFINVHFPPTYNRHCFNSPFFSCYRSKTTHLFHILLLAWKVKYWHKRKKWFQPLYKTANIHEGVSNYTVPPSVSTKISMCSPSKMVRLEKANK